MVRFIHAADLHLDTPFSGLTHLPDMIWNAIRESTFLSLHNIVSIAIKEKVDFVLFSGDIYDVEDRSVRAQARFKKEMNRLKQMNIEVYLIHGNHDFFSNTSLHLTLPDNVKIFGKEVETFIYETNKNERVALSGFSYEKRWIHNRMITQYPKRKNGVEYHIGLLHGYQEGDTYDHAKYAPFSISELQEKQYDYWALGHIHQRKKVCEHPLAYYPGNTQGRNKNETGEKGCLLIELTQDISETEFIPTAPIEWEKKMIDVSREQTLNGIFENIQHYLFGKKEKNRFFSLTLLISEDLPQSVKQKIDNQDFIDALQMKDEKNFQWIVDLGIREKNSFSRIPALKKMFPEAWEKAIKKISSESMFEETTKEFFHQVKQASLLKERSESYRKDRITRALELVEREEGENEHEN